MAKSQVDERSITFRTQYDKPRPVREGLGSRVKQLYAPKFNDSGVLYLEEAGKHDLYAEIQSHRDSVDIHVLLARYRNGDESAFERIQGAYGDFTKMPATFAEALNTMIAAEQYFKSLPVEIRSKYGHDFNQFISAMDSPSWFADVGIELPGIDGSLSSAAPEGASPQSSEDSAAPSAQRTQNSSGSAVASVSASQSASVDTIPS